MDSYEGGVQNKDEMHPVAVQVKATESVFQLYAEKGVKTTDFQCQWPCGELEAPACMQILSPASPTESFFICGQVYLHFVVENKKGHTIK